jgi:hypothetical protein
MSGPGDLAVALGGVFRFGRRLVLLQPKPPEGVAVGKPASPRLIQRQSH